MLAFGSFELDTGTRRLTRGGNEIHLRPKAFELLALLLEAAPRLVPKREIHDRLWPGGVVADATLVALVKELRRALDGDEPESSVIRTVHRVGYAIDAPVRRAAPQLTEHWLTSNTGHRLPLVEGENVIGRDPQSAIWLDYATVSRRHACIRVENGRALLQDLGSKNGTSVVGRKAPGMDLRDGDLVVFGKIVLTYRHSSASPATVSALNTLHPVSPGS